jgi:hypothetical protein
MLGIVSRSLESVRFSDPRTSAIAGELPRIPWAGIIDENTISAMAGPATLDNIDSVGTKAHGFMKKANTP